MDEALIPKCQICGRRQRVTDKGLILAHEIRVQSSTKRTGRLIRCAGSCQPPAYIARLRRIEAAARTLYEEEFSGAETPAMWEALGAALYGIREPEVTHDA